MPDTQLTVDQFAQKIKDKYPQYNSMPNADLTTKILDKYPQYKTQVDLGTPNQGVLGTLWNGITHPLDAIHDIVKGKAALTTPLTEQQNIITGLKGEQEKKISNPTTESADLKSEYTPDKVIARSNSNYSAINDANKLLGLDSQTQSDLNKLGITQQPAQIYNPNHDTDKSQPTIIPLQSGLFPTNTWQKDDDANIADKDVKEFISNKSKQLEAKKTALLQNFDLSPLREASRILGQLVVENDEKVSDARKKLIDPFDKAQQQLQSLGDQLYTGKALKSTSYKNTTAATYVDPNDVKGSLQKLDESTKLYKGLFTNSNKDLKDFYGNIGITRNFIGNLDTQDSKKQYLDSDDKSTEKEKYIYDGVLPEIYALNESVKTDKKLLSSYQKQYDSKFSESVLNQLARQGKSLTEEEKQEMGDLSNLIKSIKTSTDSRDLYQSRLIDFAKKETPDYVNYLTNQDYLNKQMAEHPLMSTIGAIAFRPIQIAKNLFNTSLILNNEIARTALKGQKSDFTTQEYSNLNKKFDNRANQILSLSPFDQSPQLQTTLPTSDKPQYVDIDKIPLSVNSKNPTFYPWLYQAGKTGVDITGLGLAGGAGGALVDGILGESIVPLVEHSIATLPRYGLAQGTKYLATSGLGVIAPMIFMSTPETMKTEMDSKGLNPEQAFKIATLRNIAMGASFSLFPYQKLLPEILAGKSAEELGTLAEDESYQKAIVEGLERESGTKISDRLGSFISNPWSKTKEFAKGATYTAVEVNLQNAASDLLNTLVDKKAQQYKEDYKVDTDLSNTFSVDKFFQTVATMVIPILEGGYHRVQNENYVFQRARYNVAEKPEAYEYTIDKQLKDGDIDENEVNRRKAKIADLKSTYDRGKKYNDLIDNFTFKDKDGKAIRKLTDLEKNSIKDELFQAHYKESELEKELLNPDAKVEKITEKLEKLQNGRKEVEKSISEKLDQTYEDSESDRINVGKNSVKKNFSDEKIQEFTLDQAKSNVERLQEQYNAEPNAELKELFKERLDKVNDKIIDLQKPVEEQEVITPDDKFEGVLNSIKDVPEHEKYSKLVEERDKLIDSGDFDNAKKYDNEANKYQSAYESQKSTHFVDNLKEGDKVGAQNKNWEVDKINKDENGKVTSIKLKNSDGETTNISRPYDDLYTPKEEVKSKENEISDLKKDRNQAIKDWKEKNPKLENVDKTDWPKEKQKEFDAINNHFDDLEDHTKNGAPKEEVTKKTSGNDYNEDYVNDIKESEKIIRNYEQTKGDFSRPLEVARTIITSLDPSEAKFYGQEPLDLTDKSNITRLNTLANLKEKAINSKTEDYGNMDEHGYKFMILPTKILLEKLGITNFKFDKEGKLEAELLKYFSKDRVIGPKGWKNLPETFEKEMKNLEKWKESVLVANKSYKEIKENDILKFDLEGNVSKEGMIAYYTLPETIKAHDDSNKGIKPPKDYLKKENNETIYENSLETLELLRQSKNVNYVEIGRISEGVQFKRSFTEPTKINDFLDQAKVTPETSSIYISKQLELGTKKGGAYLYIGGDKKFEIQRPNLEKIGNPTIDAIINLAKGDDELINHRGKLLNIDDNLGSWEGRRNYIKNLIFLGVDKNPITGIELNMSKRGIPYFKLNQNFIDYLLSNGISEAKDLKYVEDEDKNRFYNLFPDNEKHADLLKSALKFKKLNIVDYPDYTKFDHISFDGKNFDSKTYKSYKEFIQNNTSVFAKVPKGNKLAEEAGIKAKTGQYATFGDILSKESLELTHNFDDLNEQKESELADVTKNIKNLPIEEVKQKVEEIKNKYKTKEQEVLDKDKNIEQKVIDEVKPEQKLSREEFKKKQGDILERSKEYSDKVSKEQEVAASKWWKESPISEHIELKDLSNIINSDAYADFKNAVITLYNGSNPSDLYHEGFHAFSQMFLSKKQKGFLYTELKKQSGETRLFLEGKEIKTSYKDLTDIQAEEVLAEDFRKFALSDGKLKFNRQVSKNTIFSRIWNAIKSLVNKISGKLSIDEAYSKLHTGDINKYKPSMQNAIFGRLTKSFDAIYENNGENFIKTIGSKQINEYARLIDSSISQFLQEKGKFSTIFTKDAKQSQINSKALYDYAKGDIGYRLEELDKNSDIYQDLKLLHDNFDRFTDIHKDNSNLFKDLKTGIKYNSEGEVKEESATYETTSQLEEDKQGGRNLPDWEDDNKSSAIEKASNQILFLMDTLPKYIEGKQQLDRFGFPQLASFDVTWYRLAQELKGIHDIDQMYSKIDKLGEKYPEFKDLKGRLPDITSNIDLNNKQFLKNILLLQSFIKDFSKPMVEMYEGILESKDGVVSFKNIKTTTKATNQIGKIYSDIFKDKTEGNFVIKDVDGNNRLNTRAVIVNFGAEVKQADKNLPTKYVLSKLITNRLSFLESLGFEFSKETLESSNFKDLINQDKSREKYGKDVLGYLFEHLNKLEKAGISITDPVEALSRDPKIGNKPIYDDNELPIKSEQANLNLLLQTEIEASHQYFEDSAINPNGDLIYQIQNYSKIALMYSDINNNELYKTYQDLVSNLEYEFLDTKKNTGLQGSLWLESLFNLDEKDPSYGTRRLGTNKEPIQLVLRDIGGLKYKDETSTSGNKTTDLTTGDKIFYDLNSFINNGLIEHMRYGDKASSRGTQLSEYLTSGKSIPFELNSFQKENIPSKVLGQFTKYLNREINQIKEYAEINKLGSKTKVKNYNTNNEFGKEFRIFNGILDENTRTKLKKLIDKGISNEEILKNVDLKKHLEDFFKTETNKLKKKIAEYPGKFLKSEHTNFLEGEEGILHTDASKRLKYEQLLHAFTVNNYVYNIEQMSLLNGDLAQFKNPNDVHKRLSADSATGDIPFTNKYLTKFLDQTGNAREGFLRDKKGLKIENKPNDNQFNTSIFNDVKLKSDYIESYMQQILGKNYKLDIPIKELVNMSPKEAVNYLDSQKNKLHDKALVLKTILDTYGKITEGDALGMCTLDFYRNFKIRIGQWDDKMEVAYTKLSQERDLDEGEMAYFMPIKAQYSGQIANAEQELGKYLRVEAFDKFALVPLIPSAIKGKPLEKFENNLVKQNIHYAMFESGSKKSALTDENGEFNKFYQGDVKNRTLNTGDYKINSKFWNGLKEQVYIEPKIKDNIIYATQFNKLFNVNMFEQGKPISEKLGELTNKYKDIRDNLIHNELGKIMKELNIKDGIIQNQKGLSKILMKEFNTRDLPDNMLDFLKTDNQGNLVFNLDSSLSRQKVNSVLLSIVNNRLIRYKMNGENYIQTAFTGWDTDNNLKIYQKGADGKTTKMEVKVSIAKFKNLLNLNWKGETIGTIENLNRLIKDPEFIKEHEDKFSLVGVRIPVQGANSMINGIVQEFLPEATGSIIVLPTEITAIAGSDFDIDKLSMYTPNLFRNGELVTKDRKKLEEIIDRDIHNIPGPYALKGSIKEILLDKEGNKQDRINNTLNKFIDKNPKELASINLLKGDLGTIIKDLTDLTENHDKYAAQNELTKTIQETLSQPEMYESLFTPNSNDILHPLADDISKPKKLDYSGVLSYTEQLNQFEANLVGKKTLGIAAVANTFNQLLKQSGMYLNEGKIRLVHNSYTLEDGTKKISLADIKDANNEHKISEIISQFINGYVDVAKDPWVFRLGASYEAAPSILFLNHAGVPIEDNIFLHNQPIVKKYLDYMKLRNFITGKAMNPEFYSKFGEKNAIDAVYKEFLNYVPDKKVSARLEKETTDDIFNKNNLQKNIGKKNIDVDKWEQAKIFKHFLEIVEQTKQLKNLQSALNFDTKKIGSVYESFEKIKKYNEILENPMFPKDKIEEIKKNSVISMLDFNPLVSKLYPQFYKVIEDPKINRFLTERIDRDANFGLKEKFESRFKNDFVQFIYQMFGKEPDSDRLVYDRIKDAFTGEMASRLKDIKKKYPELSKELPILDLLVGDRSKKSELYNIKPKKQLKETLDINMMIEDFKKGLEYSGKTADENLEIQDFFKDLQRFGFIQSGVQTSPLSYTKYLPTGEISNTIDQALSEVKRLLDKDDVLIDSYYKWFKKNNPDLFKKKAIEGIETNNERTRFKPNPKEDIKKAMEEYKNLPKYKDEKPEKEKIPLENKEELKYKSIAKEPEPVEEEFNNQEDSDNENIVEGDESESDIPFTDESIKEAKDRGIEPLDKSDSPQVDMDPCKDSPNFSIKNKSKE